MEIKSSTESIQKPDFRDMPIQDASVKLRERFQQMHWRNIAIVESVTTEPKSLEVIPNTPDAGCAMAWPSYYKTVQEGHEDDGEPKGFGELAQTTMDSIQRSPIVKVRRELRLRLNKAQSILDSNPLTTGLQIVVVDGYRPVGVQKSLFDVYYTYVATQNPTLSKDALKDMARKMVSEPPTDLAILETSPPPHSTGGSVDVILVFKDKINIQSDYWLNQAMVPFGAKFDEMMNPTFKDERSETVFYEKKSQQSSLTPEEQDALGFRRILYHALTQVGFTNYFNEFWHYDLGNQFNASVVGKQEAKYGFAGGISNGQIIVEDLSAEKKAFRVYSATHGVTEAERVRGHFGL